VFEDDIIAALANREIEAAAVTRMTVGWFNLQHADKPLRLIPAFDNDQDLNWNIAAGLLRPDDQLRERVDAAIEALLADGTIARIYAGYGIELRPPQ
jgi:polar amino acid transport system substrate-binding protein